MVSVGLKSDRVVMYRGGNGSFMSNVDFPYHISWLRYHVGGELMYIEPCEVFNMLGKHIHRLVCVPDKPCLKFLF